MAAVYPNLAGEIAKRGIKKCVLAKEAGISDRVLRNKMAGKGSFSIQEAIEIKNKFFPDYTVDDLFRDRTAKVSIGIVLNHFLMFF